MTKAVPPTTKYLDSLVEQYLSSQSSGLGFAIGYATPSFEGIYVKGNVANQFKQDLGLSEDTYFEISSLTKIFTAALCALVGARHQPKWQTQNIGNYLDSVITGGLRIGPQFQYIGLTSLLNYTSGLPSDGGIGILPSIPGPDWPVEMPTPYSPTGMLGFLNMTSLQPSQSGLKYTYSDLAFSILSQIVPLFVPSTPPPKFNDLASDVLLGPLNLYNTLFFEDVPIDELCLGYSYADPTNAPQPVRAGWQTFDAYYGAGGLVSTPGDMMTWLQYNMFLRTNPAISPYLRMLQSASTSVPGPNHNSLGLGWFVRPSPRLPGGTAIWIDGQLPGFNSYMVLVPGGTDSPSPGGVFVLTNCDSLVNSSKIEVPAVIGNELLTAMLT
jgi:serine-type D-Ala-D-Ala carboxypeptidase/endopeptidase